MSERGPRQHHARALTDRIGEAVRATKRKQFIDAFTSLPLEEQQRQVDVVNATLRRDTPYTIESYIEEMVKGAKTSEKKLKVLRKQWENIHPVGSRKKPPKD